MMQERKILEMWLEREIRGLKVIPLRMGTLRIPLILLPLGEGKR